MNIKLATLLLLVTLSLLFLSIDRKLITHKVREVPYVNATDAAEKLKEWSTWLTGLETAMIAAMGALAKDRKFRIADKNWAFLALLFLCASLLLSVWMVASLSNIMLQLGGPGSIVLENDIYNYDYDTTTHWRLGAALFLQHIYFMIGALCFAVMIYTRFLSSKSLE